MSDAKPAPEGKSPETTGTGTEAPPGPKGPEQKPGEIGGPRGPEPTRYGDWENKGRCTDF
ncbi:MAG TPA: DUF1674 domain-containing protein [Azospirillum sp.]